MAIAFAYDLPPNKYALGFARHATNFFSLEEKIETSISERRIKEALFACDPLLAQTLNQTGDFLGALYIRYEGSLPEENELLRRYSSLKRYAENIRKGESPSKKRQELAEFYVETKDPVVKSLLVTEYRRVLFKILRRKLRWGTKEETFEELVQELSMVIANKLESYDPQRLKFATYIEGRIQGTIKDYFRGEDIVKRTEREQIHKIKRARKEFADEKILAPTMNQLAERTGLSLEQITDAISAEGRTMIFLDAPIKGDGRKKFLHEILSNEREDEEMDIRDIERLYDVIDQLPSRLRYVIIQDFFVDNNHIDIGRELGVSESRISQLRKKGLKELRRLMNLQD